MTALIATLLFTQAPAPLAEIPFEREPGRIWLKVVLNGKPIDAILDSGANGTSADAATALAAGASKGEEFPIAGAGGNHAIQAWVAKGLTLAFPGTTIAFPVDFAFPMTTQRNEGKRAIRLTLGTDFFEKYVVQIDYTTTRIKLYDPATYRAPEGFAKLDVKFDENFVPLTVGRLQLPATNDRDVSVMFDTGSPMGIVVTNRMVRQDRLDALFPSSPVLEVADAQLGGDLRVKAIAGIKGRIGDTPLKGDAFIVLTEGGALGKDADHDVLLGDDLMRHFHMVFDYANARVYMKLNGK